MEDSQKPAKEVSYYFLMAFMGIILFTHIAQAMITTFVTNWESGPFRRFMTLFWVIYSLSFFLLPFTIKKKSVRVVAFIIATILAIFMLWQNLG